MGQRSTTCNWLMLLTKVYNLQQTLEFDRLKNFCIPSVLFQSLPSFSLRRNTPSLMQSTVVSDASCFNSNELNLIFK